MHHTKDKGDLGVAKAFGDLVEQGFMVLFPATEHAPCDLVAYRDGQFHRVQVKYRALRDGAMVVELSSGWADRHGSHKRPIDRGSIEAICIYCPDTDLCYYVRPPLGLGELRLRVVPPRNNQRQGVNMADSFRMLLPSQECSTG
jgi:PD-(D/E)XK endonuclease